MFATKYVASNHCYGRSNNYSSDQFTSFNQLMKGIPLIAGAEYQRFVSWLAWPCLVLCSRAPTRGLVVSASASVLVGHVFGCRPGLTKTM